MYFIAEVEIESQIIPIPDQVLQLEFRKSKAIYELVFLATELPPMGYKSYYIQKTSKKRMKPVPDQENVSSFTSIGNEVII